MSTRKNTSALSNMLTGILTIVRGLSEVNQGHPNPQIHAASGVGDWSMQKMYIRAIKLPYTVCNLMVTPILLVTLIWWLTIDLCYFASCFVLMFVTRTKV